MLNGKSTLAHLEELDRSIELLKGHRTVSEEAFMKDVAIQDAVCRRFQIAAECCIDLGNHIIAGYGLRRPETNSDIFLVLFDSGYIEDKRFAEKMVEMVKFRNLLVHFYMKVDMERVYAYLQNDLWLFEAFHRMVLRLLPSE